MEFLGSFKRTLVFIFIVIFPILIITLAISKPKQDNKSLEELRLEYSQEKISSVDHSKFEELQVEFESPHEITAACLSCHTERGKEVLNNAHWNWEREEYIDGRGITHLGKKNLLNNFCTGILSNEKSCTKCHIGYGWEDKSFDFTNQYNVDCLICHDQTNTYEKASGGSGYPVMDDKKVDFNKIAQSVGSPTKYNCGYCHFNSAGGNNVKHGDLEFALLDTDKSVDVHMGKDGLDFSCVECHKTENHQMKGKYYAVSSSPQNNSQCSDCHGDFPHLNNKLNEHSIKVDCRTCHIPEYAKVNATKMYWDWSTAGKRKYGLPYAEKDSLGNKTYMSEKGYFEWETNVAPEYVWFNGYADHHLISDKITTDTVNINTLLGSADDPQSKIIPVKVHRGKQPYDTEYKTLIQLKLWGESKGTGAFWKDLDWEIAINTGMDYVGLPYSGKHDFIHTKMYLPVSHMVSPSDKALTCTDCHSRENSRMKNVEGIYIPGKSYNATINNIGLILILGSILGIVGHATLRILASYRRRQKNN